MRRPSSSSSRYVSASLTNVDSTESGSERLGSGSTDDSEGEREAAEGRTHGGSAGAVRASVRGAAYTRRRLEVPVSRLRAPAESVSLRGRRCRESRGHHDPRRSRRAHAVRPRAAADPPQHRTNVQSALEVHAGLSRLPVLLRAPGVAAVAAAHASYGSPDAAVRERAVERPLGGLEGVAAPARRGTCSELEALRSRTSVFWASSSPSHRCSESRSSCS